MRLRLRRNHKHPTEVCMPVIGWLLFQICDGTPMVRKNIDLLRYLPCACHRMFDCTFLLFVESASTNCSPNTLGESRPSDLMRYKIDEFHFPDTR